ncbi:MAG: nucleoside-diphosphate kinase [Parcubacteria group bacterium]|jgi:nucleoside-diphosphate kinase
MKSDASKERTFVIIKPDGVQRSLIGEIIKRFERTGLKLVGLKMFIPSAGKVREHYTLDPKWLENVGVKSIEAYDKKGLEPPTRDPMAIGNQVLDRLEKYLTAGPVIGMIWQGNQAVGIVRKVMGGTEPLTSDVGTIRGDLTVDSYSMADVDDRAVRNLLHASGSVEEAEMEIKHWFSEDEILNYRLIQESILYDVNLDGILE